MYYWKTTFNLNNYEQNFLKEHNIDKLYIRMFDVAIDETYNYEYPIPIATIQFQSPIPKGIEIVPTVFITTEAIAKLNYYNDTETYAKKIVDRILAMVEYNELGEIHEIQFDCDWTNSTEEKFFSLCKHAKTYLHDTFNIQLSATIRLHQLSKKTPPVDKGILMLYNTGGVRAYNEENSILQHQDVANYIHEYKLPLDFALPTFNWGVCFKNKEFQYLLHKSEYSDTSKYRNTRENWYEVISAHSIEKHDLTKGDEIRFEQSDFSEIIKVRQLIEKSFSLENSTIILYHLDSANLSNYTYEEIEQLY